MAGNVRRLFLGQRLRLGLTFLLLDTILFFCFKNHDDDSHRTNE